MTGLAKSGLQGAGRDTLHRGEQMAWEGGAEGSDTHRQTHTAGVQTDTLSHA